MTALGPRCLPGVLLALGLLCAQPGPADEPKGKPIPLPPALTKAFPEGPDDLRAIEKHVQEVLKKVMPAVVGIRVGASAGSGVIISKDGHVLTAGHVSGEPGREIHVILPSGRVVKARALGRNTGIDSGLIKITEPGEWPHVEMGHSKDVRQANWVVAVGHPGGFRPNRTPVVRLGRVLLANRYVVLSDCTLVGGDSGGPLFDMTGRVVGIHSRIGGAIAQNFHVPVDVYRQTWERLARGDSWGGALGQQVVQTPGGKAVLEVAGNLKADDPRDSRKTESHCQVHKFKMSPGSVYTIDMTSPDLKKLDPYLRLEDSKGIHLAEDDDGGGHLHARLVYRPARADEYRIVATTSNPGEVGPYKLVVRRVDLREGAVGGKTDLLRHFRITKPIAPVMVEQLSRIGLALHLHVTVFDAKGNPATGKELPFRWAKGSTKLRTDANGVARLPLKKETVKDLFADVPQDCKAAFELTDANSNFFPVDLGKDWAKVKVKSAGGKLVLQAEGRLTEHDDVDTARKKCWRQVYLFNMTPGFTYTLDLESLDFDSYLRVEDSAGKQLAEDDDSAGRMNSRIVFRPTKEEAFRIVVTTCDPDQAGAYRLTIHRAENKAQPKNEKK